MKKATHDCMRMMAAMVAFAAVAVSLAGAPEFKIGTVGNPISAFEVEGADGSIKVAIAKA